MKDQLKEAIQQIKEENYTKGVELIQSVIDEKAKEKITESKKEILSLHKFMEKKMKEDEDYEKDDKSDDDSDDDDDDDDEKDKDEE